MIRIEERKQDNVVTIFEHDVDDFGRTIGVADLDGLDDGGTEIKYTGKGFFALFKCCPSRRYTERRDAT